MLPVRFSSARKLSSARRPLVVPDSARIVSHAWSARSIRGRPSAGPPRTRPWRTPSSATSRSGVHETPFHAVPAVSTSGPSAVMRACSAG